ncbi:MAG TPA: hypothetical protein PKE28_04340 [Bacteroidales bacterium]|jgi:hypothetical protein|nr:hypothetical protein [Bacteroidales bacterium]MDI9533740.1 hypothetical protein [Bacteroidota bacterium]HMT66805.1 hypothetical protein [Bacteroidales bacterium]
MKTTGLTFILALFFAVGNISDAGAQTWMKRLGEKAEEAAKRKVEKKVEEKVDEAVERAFDKTEESIRKERKESGSRTPVVEPPDTGEPAENSSDWDNNEPYYALKQGTRIEYTVYNGSGKVQGYNKQEVLKITRSGNSVEAVVSGMQTDSKGKVQNTATVSLRYKNGNFHVNLLEMMPLQGLENAEIDANMSGNDMIIPSKLSPGQILPDAEATFKMRISDGSDAADLPPLVFHIYNRRAVRAESVETPMGKFVCFKIIQTVEADYPLIGTQQATGITWIGKGIGVVKSETYDAKGKLTNRMLLTGLE